LIDIYIDRCAFLLQNFSEILDSLDTIATEIEDAAAAAAAQEPEPEPEPHPELELEQELEPEPEPEQEPESEPTEEGIPPDTADAGGGGE
jgi:hypothetical protein